MKIVDMTVCLGDMVPDGLNEGVRTLSGVIPDTRHVWLRSVTQSLSKWGYCVLSFFAETGDAPTFSPGYYHVVFVRSGTKVPYCGNNQTTAYIGNIVAEDGTLWHVVRMVQ